MNLLFIGIGIGHEKELIIGYRFKFFISCIPFHLRQFARLLAEEMLSYSSAVMRVALAQSYLTKMSYSL